LDGLEFRIYTTLYSIYDGRFQQILGITREGSRELWSIKGEVYRELIYLIFDFYYSFDHWAFEFVDRDKESYNFIFIEDIWKYNFIHNYYKNGCIDQFESIKKNILDKKKSEMKEQLRDLHITSDPFIPAEIKMKDNKPVSITQSNILIREPIKKSKITIKLKNNKVEKEGMEKEKRKKKKRIG
jgi:hypothetical protein